ncbi:MAG: NAD(P)H-dependent oxidoreductase [Bacteroidia bacterium]|nr:NAD(P)H-dependent oxidoreductase [Bacteroidia bacterium]
MKKVIIQGSSRSGGNTHSLIKFLQSRGKFDVIDLKNYEISPYDYEHKNREDDFLPLMRKLLGYDLLVFATPIYWYSMSGIMKNFVDRFTDCLKIEKELGRKLRGKSMAAFCCGSDPDEIESFFLPFELTAGYLGMQYLGQLHAWIEEEEIEELVKEKLIQFMNSFEDV